MRVQFWLGDATLDRHVCLAVHGLKEARFGIIAQRARELLVATNHVNPGIGLLPEDKWIESSIKRLINGAFIKKTGTNKHPKYQPARAIYQGWP